MGWTRPPPPRAWRVASLAMAIAGIPFGLLCGIGFLLEIAVLPWVRRPQPHPQVQRPAHGEGLALAGIIVSGVVLVLTVVLIVLLVVIGASARLAMSNIPPPPPPGEGPPPGGDAPWWAQAGSGSTPTWWKEPGPPPGATGRRRGRCRSPRRPTPPTPRRTGGPKTMAKGAVTSLVVGLLSLFCCGIVLGPIAIVQGSQARFRVRTSNGRLGGDGIALARHVPRRLSVFLFFFGCGGTQRGTRC